MRNRSGALPGLHETYRTDARIDAERELTAALAATGIFWLGSTSPDPDFSRVLSCSTDD